MLRQPWGKVLVKAFLNKEVIHGIYTGKGCHVVDQLNCNFIWNPYDKVVTFGLLSSLKIRFGLIKILWIRISAI